MQKQNDKNLSAKRIQTRSLFVRKREVVEAPGHFGIPPPLPGRTDAGHAGQRHVGDGLLGRGGGEGGRYGGFLGDIVG